jgi:multidrug resistance efflux pump
MPSYTVLELLQMRLDGEQKSVDLALQAVKQAQVELERAQLRRDAALHHFREGLAK